jgi:regulatory protein
MKITSVEKSRNKNMVRIYIDDSYSFTIPEEDYIRNNLYEETEISQEKLELICFRYNENRAFRNLKNPA